MDAPPATTTRTEADYAARIDFVVELAEHLHAYGTTTQRLELAIISASQHLGLECEPWTNPTGMILSFNNPSLPIGAGDITRVLRLAPGDTDLARLVETDRIAESVIAGEMGPKEGHAALDRLGRPPGRRQRLMEVLAFGVVSAAVGALLRLPWLDIATAGMTGLLIGTLVQLARPRPRLREAEEAVAGLLAGFVVVLVAAYVGPLNQNTVIIASVIVLLPGLTLTNAMSELASNHMVAGTTRFFGAMTSVLKLTVGSVLAVSLAHAIGIEPQVRALRPQPEWVEWGGLIAAAFSFAVLFRAAPRDYPVVMLAAVTGYLVSRFGGLAWGSGAGIFLSALALTAGGNAYARWWNRPGALVRVPGIIMLVPGSASLRSLLTLVQQQDAGGGQVALLGVLNILAALVAGLLFGNLLVSARRAL